MAWIQYKHSFSSRNFHVYGKCKSNGTNEGYKVFIKFRLKDGSIDLLKVQESIIPLCKDEDMKY